MKNVITKVEIKNLWGRIDLLWDKIDPQVNIIIGVNGSGKSTLINAMYNYLKNPDCKLETRYNLDYLSLKFSNNEEMRSDIISDKYPIINVEKLSENNDSFEYIINRMKTLIEAKEETFDKDIKTFSNILGKLFTKTRKTVEVSESEYLLQLKDRNNKTIDYANLSSGEKRMLIFLYKVFLTRKKDYILFLDEPEWSLHVEWQSQLIDIILEINPNCQLFIATHSPNIFMNGWGDKLQFIEDYLTGI